MRHTGVLAVAILLISACGGSGAVPETTSRPTTTSTVPDVCPSGAVDGRGGGPAYLAGLGANGRSVADTVPDGRPPVLGEVAAAIPEELMVGLAYTGCSMIHRDAVFEEMSWSNGLGLLLVAWQEWPRVTDPSGSPFGGEAEQRGIVQVSRAEVGPEGNRTRVVRLFDGLKLVAVTSFGLSTMSIDQLEEVGWVVYDGLPIDMSGAEVESATVGDVLGSIASEDVSVSEPEGLLDVSPFTALVGAAHTSYTAVVAGTDVSLYDFGLPSVAERTVAMVSSDGRSIAHRPAEWAGGPHVWSMGRVVLAYQGTNEEFVEVLTEALGPPVAGAPEQPEG